MVRLPERVMILPFCTSTAPTGTSPAMPAARASSKACCMKARSVSIWRENSTHQKKGRGLTPRSPRHPESKRENQGESREPSTGLLDNWGMGKDTTAHDIEKRFSTPPSFLFDARPQNHAVRTLCPLKNPAWKSGEIPSRKAG